MQINGLQRLQHKFVLMEITEKVHITKFGGFVSSFVNKSISEKMIVLLYLFALVPMLYLVLMAINARIGLSEYSEVLPIIVVFTLSLLGFKQLWKELKWWDFFLFFLIIWGYLYSPHVYPHTAIDIMLRAPEFILRVLPFFIIGASINLVKQSNTLLHIGRIGVLLTLFLTLANQVFGLSLSFYEGDENMGLAYNFLPPLILVVWNELRHHNVVDFSISAVGLVLLLGFGSRGPVLSLVVFAALSLFIKMKSRSSRIILLLMAVAFYFFLTPIISFFGDILSVLGMSDRVVTEMADLQNISTTGRDKLFELVVNQIESNGMYGDGLYSDRSFLEGFNYAYAHNIFLEMAFDFGVYITIGIFLFFLLILYKNFKQLPGADYKTLYLAFFSFGFIPLLVSNSYLEWPYFWLFCGLMSAVLKFPNNNVYDIFRKESM